MKKLLIVSMMILSISGISFGASSEDVYVRYDVFSARMDGFMSEIRLMNEQLRSELKQDIQEVKQDIQNVRNELKQDIQATNARIDVTNARLDDLYTIIYWGFALMGMFIGLIAFAPVLVNMFQSMRKPPVTLEDVERLIDVKLSEKLP